MFSQRGNCMKKLVYKPGEHKVIGLVMANTVENGEVFVAKVAPHDGYKFVKKICDLGLKSNNKSSQTVYGEYVNVVPVITSDPEFMGKPLTKIRKEL